MDNKKQYVYKCEPMVNKSVHLQVNSQTNSPKCHLLIDTENRICILDDKKLDAFESLDLHIGPDESFFCLTYQADVHQVCDLHFKKGDKFDYTLHTTE